MNGPNLRVPVASRCFGWESSVGQNERPKSRYFLEMASGGILVLGVHQYAAGVLTHGSIKC